MSVNQEARILHSKHSSLVRNMKLVGVQTLHSKSWDVHAEINHILKTPTTEGYAVYVSFNEAHEHPDHILIRSTNWKREWEPSGWITKVEARKLWKSLIAVGMVAF